METAAAYFVQRTAVAVVVLQELFGSVSNVRSSKWCSAENHLARTAEGCPQRQWSVVAHRRTAVVASYDHWRAAGAAVGLATRAGRAARRAVGGAAETAERCFLDEVKVSD